MVNNKEEQEKNLEAWRIAFIAILVLAIAIIVIFYLSRSARNKVFKPRVARPNAQGVPKIRKNLFQTRPAAQRINYGY